MFLQVIQALSQRDVKTVAGCGTGSHRSSISGTRIPSQLASERPAGCWKAFSTWVSPRVCDLFGVLLLSLLPTCPLKSVKCPCKYNTNPNNLFLNIWAVLMKNLTSVLQTDYYGWSWRSLLCPGWDVLDTHKNASVRCPCWEWFPIVVWVRNVPNSLGYLNSWSPFFGHVWEVWVVQPSRRKFNTAQALILKALCHF